MSKDPPEDKDILYKPTPAQLELVRAILMARMLRRLLGVEDPPAPRPEPPKTPGWKTRF